MIPVQNRPILLSGQVTLAPGGSAELPQERMINPLNTAMLIDEIRFRTPPIYESGTGYLFGSHLAIRCGLRMGRIDLTNGYIPVANFGKVTLEETNAGIVVSGQGRTIGAPQAFITARHTWKLPKPLYVPRGEYLVPRMYYDPVYNNTLFPGTVAPSITVDVSYAGRSLPPDFPVPKSIAMPWVTSFLIRPLAITSGNTQTSVSNQANLVNPFDKPMFIQRFIGRSLLFGGAANGSLPFQPVELANATIDGSEQAYLCTSVRAVDSLNNILVRDPTPFTHLFQYMDRSWTVNSQLPAQGFYIMTVEQQYNKTSAPTTAYLAHAISMVGYREVELQ